MCVCVCVYWLCAEGEGCTGDWGRQVESLGDLPPQFLVDDLHQATLLRYQPIEHVQIQDLFGHDGNTIHWGSWNNKHTHTNTQGNSFLYRQKCVHTLVLAGNLWVFDTRADYRQSLLSPFHQPITHFKPIRTQKDAAGVLWHSHFFQPGNEAILGWVTFNLENIKQEAHQHELQWKSVKCIKNQSCDLLRYCKRKLETNIRHHPGEDEEHLGNKPLFKHDVKRKIQSLSSHSCPHRQRGEVDHKTFLELHGKTVLQYSP